uniref:Vesicle transport protein n=1 Tax=Entomoneis paludosa TaxID=265537 RepID=A0A7S2VC27_9STRA|mmetsp:Transcript_13973/g.28928  ORF Transcript_13973/g.28928 Transcript_13973/m.28928 type:complete len:214 (+) Transcript_13973:229-870(+)
MPQDNSTSDSFDYRSLLPQGYRARVNSSDASSPDEPAPGGGEDSWLESSCADLSFRERMLGFGTCMIAGYMLSFGSFWRIRDLIMGDPYPLVLHTTVGNILSFAGSFFLVGPKAQWNRLWDEKRKMASQVYLTSLALIFAIIFIHPPGPEGLYLFLLLIVQYGALTWYCLSYIPFGQETVKSYVGRFMTFPSTGGGSGGGSNDLDLSYTPAPV